MWRSVVTVARCSSLVCQGVWKPLASACEVRLWRLSEVLALALHQGEERPEDPGYYPDDGHDGSPITSTQPKEDWPRLSGQLV